MRSIKLVEFFEGYLKAENCTIHDYLKAEKIPESTLAVALGKLRMHANNGNPNALKLLNDFTTKRNREQKRSYEALRCELLKQSTIEKNNEYDTVVHLILEEIKNKSETCMPYELLDFYLSVYRIFSPNYLRIRAAKILQKEDYIMFQKVFVSTRNIIGHRSGCEGMDVIASNNTRVILDGESHWITEDEKVGVLKKMAELSLPMKPILYKQLFKRMFSKRKTTINVKIK